MEVEGVTGWGHVGDSDTGTFQYKWEVLWSSGPGGGQEREQELRSLLSNRGDLDQDRRAFSDSKPIGPTLPQDRFQPSPNFLTQSPTASLISTFHTSSSSSSSSSSSYPSTSTSFAPAASVYTSSGHMPTRSLSLPPSFFIIPPQPTPPIAPPFQPYRISLHDAHAQHQQLEDGPLQRESYEQDLDSLLASFSSLPHQTPISSTLQVSSLGGSHYEHATQVPSSYSTGRAADWAGNWSDSGVGLPIGEDLWRKYDWFGSVRRW